MREYDFRLAKKRLCSQRDTVQQPLSDAIVNFFSFHGERTFIHYHDVAHYYLGSKYFPEMGYTGLYTAMLRAEAEVYSDHFKTLEARDLSTNELVPIRTLLRRSEPVKSSFTPARWQAFRKDVRFFREALGAQYGTVLRDHGFNPTPFWALLGGTLANLVPAGNHRGILLLTLLDPVLLIACFGAVWWAFRSEGLLLSLIHFGVIFGAGFGWTGGAFLRYPWFFLLVTAFCFLQKKRYALFGAFLAGSSLLRVFPAFLMAGFLCKTVGELLRTRRCSQKYQQAFLSFAGVLVSGFLVSAIPARGAQNWIQFRQNTTRQIETISPNVVGLTRVLSYRQSQGAVSRGEFRDLKRRQTSIHRIQLGTVFVLTLLLLAWVSQRGSDLKVGLAAIPLLYVGVNLACYYYVFLILLTLVNRRRPKRLALIFGVEFLSYSLLLFEERESVLFFYRSLLVLYFLVALYWDPVEARMRKKWREIAPSDDTPKPLV